MKYCLVATLAVALAAAPASSRAQSAVGEDFERGVPHGWATEGLGPQPDKGRVEDDQETGGNHFLRISTDGSFYSFGIDTPFDPEQYPVLTWRWRVERMPTRADISTRSGDDAAARLFVVFRDAADPSIKRKLEYVWDTTHAPGTIIPDPYSPDTMKAVVLESGSTKLGQWIPEKVNLVSDYQRAFGTKPGRVKTIAFASNSEETHSATVADFDDLQITEK
jgi:Protein of unknown function (DUF3047)